MDGGQIEEENGGGGGGRGCDCAGPASCRSVLFLLMQNKKALHIIII